MATRDEILRFLVEVSGEQDLETLTRSLEQLGEEAEGSEGKASELASQLDKLITASRKSADFARLAAEVEQLSSEFDDANERAYSLKAALQATEKPSAELTKEFKKAAAEVDRLAAAQSKARTQLEAVGGELRKAGVDVDRLADEQARLRREAAEASTAITTQAQRLEAARAAAERNAKALDAMADGLSRIRSGLNDASARLLKIGTAAAAAAASLTIFGTARFFSGAIESAGNFETAIARIQAATGATADDMARLREAAEQAGSSTVFTATQAAQGLEILSKAGLSAGDAIATLPQVLAVAQGQSLDMATAAQLVTDAIGIMGLSFQDSARAADVLAKGANLSNTSIEQLGNALRVAGPLAKAAGLEIEDVVGILDALASAGLRGEQAGTGLRNVLGQLADPASKARRALADLGINTSDLGQVLDGLRDAGAGAERAILAFGIEAGPTVRNLVDQGSEGIQRYVEQLKGSEGAAQQAAAVLAKTYEGALASVKSAIETVRNALATPLLEPLGLELNAIADQVREFAKTAEFAELTESIRALFVGGLEVAREFAEGIDLTDAAAKIRAFTDSARESLGDFKEGAEDALRDIRTVFQSIGLAFDAVQSGILGLAAGVAKVASAVLELEALGARFANAVDIFGLYGKVLGVDFPQAARDAEIAAGGLNAVFEEFADRFKRNFDDVRETLDQFGNAMPEAAEKAPDAAATLEAELGRVETALGNASDSAADFESSFAQAAQSAAGDAANIAQAVEGAGQGLTDLVDANAAAARRLAEAVKAGASTAELEQLQAEFDQSAAKVNDYEKTLDGAKQAAEQTSKSQADLGKATQSAGKEVGKTTDEVNKLEGGLEAADEAAQNISISLGPVSQAFADASLAIADFSFKLGGSLDMYSRFRNELNEELFRQRAAVDEYAASLERELAQYDPLNAKLEQLRSQYKFVDDARLRSIAQLEQRLEQQRESTRAEQREVFRAGEDLTEQVAQQDRRLDLREEQIEQREASVRERGQAVKQELHLYIHIENDQRAGDRPIEEFSNRALEQIASAVLQLIRRDMEGMAA